MKRFTAYFFLIAALLVLARPSQAQSNPSPNPSRPSQEQIMQELLNEVRQLRIALQRMSLASYRTQVVMERLRLQQDHIGRLNTELSGIRNKLSEVRAQNSQMVQMIGTVEDKVESGVSPPSEMNAMKAAIDEFKKLEQSLTDREIELSNELNTERANLTELNGRLDALEREMSLNGAVDEKKPVKKNR